MNTPELNSNAPRLSATPDSQTAILYLPDVPALIDGYQLRLRDALTQECTRFASDFASSLASRDARIAELQATCAGKDQRNIELEERTSVLWTTLTRTIKEKVKAEQRCAEAEKAASHPHRLNSALKDAENQLRELRVQLEWARGARDALQEERTELVAKNTALSTELATEKAARRTADSQGKENAQQAAALRQQLEMAEMAQKTAKAKVDTLTASLQTKESNVTYWMSQHTQLRVASDAAAASMREMEKRLKDQDWRHAQLAAEFEEEKKLRCATQDRLADRTREAVTLGNDKVRLEEMLSDSEHRCADAHARLERLEAELEDLKTTAYYLSAAVGQAINLRAQ